MRLSRLALLAAPLAMFAALAVFARSAPPAPAVADDASGPAVLREDWRDAKRGRVVPVKIDYPRDIAKPAPVVLISHGLGGSREGLAYAGTYWAEHGYVAIHLQHAGSDEAIWRGKPPGEALKALQAAETLAQFMARIGDVKFALDELARRNADPKWPLHGKIDLDRIAMAGHSFGAVTTQAICGETLPGKRTLGDDRIKAGIVFSPSGPRDEDARDAFASVKVPMFYWTGTKDELSPAISPLKPADRRIPFDAAAHDDEYLVILTGADHMIFNGRTRSDATKQQVADWLDLIGKGTTAFLDAYLKSDKQAADYLNDGAFAKEADKLGTFEKKLNAGK